MIHWFISVGGLHVIFAIQFLAGLCGIPEELINKILSGF